jgi:hypothetical protein
MTTMPVDESSEENIPNDSDAYYEAVASQEEIYLEEVEEELRAILIFGDQTPPRGNAKRLRSDANNDPCVVESPQEQLTDAAEELIAGDSDDPPLSEEGVAEMLRMARIPKGFPPDM